MQRPPRANHLSDAGTPGPRGPVNEATTRLGRQELPFAGGGSSIEAEPVGARPNHNFSPINTIVSAPSRSALPSIYTTPPYSTVFDQAAGLPNHAAEDVDAPRSWKRRRLGTTGQSPLPLAPANPNQSPIPERDIVQYVEM